MPTVFAMINVTRSSMPSFEEYCEEIRPLWDSHWLTNKGALHEKLRNALQEYLGVRHVALYTNGHLALEGILSALELPQGGEVITTPFTFVSTTHAIVRCGFQPVFCDINETDYTIDSQKIESLITEKTVAIMPVHVYGNLCATEEIQKLAQMYHLKVIYDAAHAFGVTKNGVGVGNFGDASMLSFHATKVYNTIEGGAVCFNDDALVQVLDDWKNFGIRGQESCAYIGGNAKMNEFQAAMGLCNLRHIDDCIKRRKRLTYRYRERLQGVHGIHLCPEQPDVQSNYAYMPVVFDGFRRSRDEVFERLKQHGFLARKYFYPLTCDLECYKGFSFANSFSVPVARRSPSQVLTLPIYADMEFEVVDQICDAILN